MSSPDALTCKNSDKKSSKNLMPIINELEISAQK
jgi:hypothetical protein